ncbi:MAG: preprotein translocase subunit SecA [Ruminococcaceae bacterium]|nr:preprotein translocase subunit SecA [Oscillospiraceae bacterium]
MIKKLIEKVFGSYSDRELKKLQPIVEEVLSLEEEYSKLSDKELKDKTPYFKKQLEEGKTLDDILPHAFATIREASYRVLGLKHYPVQIIGGIALHQGRIAEMKTGEGKTLVATLPAYLNALSGKGVHIVTVNDYLAKRDSEWMGKVYNFLGLTVGLVIPGTNPDEKQANYLADITYGTNNEFGFDYLRDNMATRKEHMVQRELNFAIVDEVDSILIDEARTPLIISGAVDESSSLYELANNFARKLSYKTVKETDMKSDEDDDSPYDCIIIEKSRNVTLTKKGHEAAEKFFGIDNLSDPENMTVAHHINQAIRAHGIMKKDINYVIEDGEVIIVDEFTGRLMYGRRYSDGLHQAIEAKEGVKIEKESKTLATITLQNYFRLYGKLSGMTGTALTEETEFQEIYKLDVLVIPTNKPVLREDLNDAMYLTEQDKFIDVIKEIEKRHKTGQPVLVGTVSIEKSELLSKLLKATGIKHNVLNAKNHKNEAEIVAQAGKLNAVTIATNMAGRGTDIKLGGNSEFLAKKEMAKLGYSEEIISLSTGFADTDNEEILEGRKKYLELLAKYDKEIEVEKEAVIKAGGLAIIGTERHESRRIDNQLRGRAGRQGDPGVTQFFISLQDDIMRLFGSDRIMNAFSGANIQGRISDMALLSSGIENAQKKVEGRNFEIRKNVLRYDDVMNKQREIIYSQRQDVLNGKDITETIQNMIVKSVEGFISRVCAAEFPDDWDMDAICEYANTYYAPEGVVISFTKDDLNYLTRDKLKDEFTDYALKRYQEKEKAFGEHLREMERTLLLNSVDIMWMEHIDNMDQLKQGIGLRAYGQKDPAVEYQNEAFEMFEEMIDSITTTTVQLILSLQPTVEVKRNEIKIPLTTSSDGSLPKGKTVVRKEAKIGRNDPCPCGSGKKYKKCCGFNENN